ncbi:MAG: hypothetical protein WB699_09535 [Bacteroidota bacterium]
MKHTFLLLSCGALILLSPMVLHAQYLTRWMAVGSLQNWFANTGSEIEEGRTTEQQDGLQWPAFYYNQDMQAAKAMWIGAENFTDEKGVTYPHKVAHVGPRVSGQDEVFPTKFEMISKYPLPMVLVDGSQMLLDHNSGIDKVDPTIIPDRMIVNEVNTVLGISMKRTIMAFSQQFNDNYMIYDYVFTNTGNTNDDAAIELPNQTVTGVFFYFQFRWAVNKDVRYVIGNNPVGWGINTLNDCRGDGVKSDPDNPPGLGYFRASYAWHGKYPVFSAYDNIGGPIWTPSSLTPNYDPTDTLGRLGAAQFVGAVTLHADKSPADTTDDPAQPFTTDYESSDDGLNRNNSAVAIGQMNAEYAWMSKGHANPRHADKVEPAGNFDAETGDPSLGTSGGYSTAIGYGPYTLKPGEKIHIVFAEAAAGLSRQECYSVGRKFKLGQIDAKTKNDSVLTGKDSLFQTFRRALANYNSGYTLPQPPDPPIAFTVTSGGDRVALSWTPATGGPPVASWLVYRSSGRMDTIYSLVANLPAGETSFNDTAVVRGVQNFYYLQAVGTDGLVTNRAYTTTGGAAGQGAFLKRAAGTSSSQIRIVPNPFSLNSDPDNLRFKQQPDKIAFYNIPGTCRIKIYTELGELIREIDHTDGSGDEYWNSITSSNQVVVSGIYIVVFEDLKTGERTIKKLAVIR